MKKELLKAKIAASLAALSLLVAIVGYFSLNGSVAWFSNNKVVDANGMQVNIEGPEVRDVTVTLHNADRDKGYKEEADANGNITKTTVIFGPEGSNTLPEYSPIYPALKYKLVRINFGDEAQKNIKFTAFTNTKDFNTELQEGKNNNLTGIVSISNVTTVTTVDGDNYVVDLTALAEADTQTFIVKDDKGKLKMRGDDIVFSFDEVQAIYILVSYDEILLSYLFSENIGIDFGSIFTNDFEMTVGVQ